MKEVICKVGWVCALLLALIMLSVKDELQTAGTVIGILGVIPVACIGYIAYSATCKEGIQMKYLAATAIGSGITAIVFLFAFLMGIVNSMSIS